MDVQSRACCSISRRNVCLKKLAPNAEEPEPKAFAIPTTGPMLPVVSPATHMHLGSEDYSAEAAQGETEVDAANHRHCDEVRPDNGKIGTAIQNGLREGDKMWGRADYPHHVLQPDGHALHRC